MRSRSTTTLIVVDGLDNPVDPAGAHDPRDAWLRLRSAGERLRVYMLRYNDAERFASDFDRIAFAVRFDHLRAQMRLSDRRDLALRRVSSPSALVGTLQGQDARAEPTRMCS